MVAGLATWLLTVGAGMRMLWVYADTPGPPAAARADVAGGAHLTRDRQRPDTRDVSSPAVRLLAGDASRSSRVLLAARCPRCPRSMSLVYRPCERRPAGNTPSLWALRGSDPGVSTS